MKKLKVSVETGQVQVQNDQLTDTFVWPPLWIARIVNHGQNVNQIIFDRVKKRDLLKAFELEFKSQLKFGA